MENFYGRGWPLKLENAKKRRQRVQISMIGGAIRPQNCIMRPYYRSISHKISDRYDSPNPFKKVVTELAS
jgi:hypothetical protein